MDNSKMEQEIQNMIETGFDKIILYWVFVNFIVGGSNHPMELCDQLIDNWKDDIKTQISCKKEESDEVALQTAINCINNHSNNLKISLMEMIKLAQEQLKNLEEHVKMNSKEF